jgi:phospholipid/cholesterol/gamma-HCH transport system substrate-binding protein
LKRTSQEFRESGVLKHLDEAIVNISQQASRAGDVMESVNKLVGDEAMTRDLRLSMQQVREATATANAIAKDLQKFSGTLERTGTNLDRLTSEATETVRDARGMVKTTQGNIDQITRQISDRLTQVSVLLDTTHSVARKLDQGKGSAGLLVNDPKLYEALVDSAKQHNVTLTDLQRLVEQWEQEGITFRVN